MQNLGKNKEAMANYEQAQSSDLDICLWIEVIRTQLGSTELLAQYTASTENSSPDIPKGSRSQSPSRKGGHVS